MWHVITWKAGHPCVALASKLFFLKSNDVLDAVLGTNLGEQQCFKFLIRQFVSLNKRKIICSYDWSETVRCLWFLWCEDLTCDWLQHNKHSRHILGVHANIITAVRLMGWCSLISIISSKFHPFPTLLWVPPLWAVWTYNMYRILTISGNNYQINM